MKDLFSQLFSRALSRKFAAVVIAIAAVSEGSLTTLQTIVVAVVASVYIIAEAALDHAGLPELPKQIAEAVDKGLELGTGTTTDPPPNTLVSSPAPPPEAR